MKKRYLSVLVLAMVVAGTVFAQNESESMPKNTITVDFGPTLVGLVMGKIGNINEHSTAFGIGMQYERQIIDKVAVGLRFAYLEHSYKFLNIESESASSIETHTRFYPAGKMFFLDGMLGYAGLSVSLSNGSDSVSAYRNYIIYGAKIGWRIDFGKPGGFIFEPSLGYYGVLGLGDTFEKRTANYHGNIDDNYFENMEKFTFIGGPRISLSCGWRF